MSYNFGAQEKCTLLFVSFPYCTPVCAKDTLLPINFLIMWGTLMSCHENEPYCFLTAGIHTSSVHCGCFSFCSHWVAMIEAVYWRGSDLILEPENLVLSPVSQ